MPEIWNLSALCRCCLVDGIFQRLDEPCVTGSAVEIYSDMMKETFGITIAPPPEHVSASHSICEMCIAQLRLAARFKRSVLAAEEKFHEYCRNEQSQVFIECPVKVEYDSDKSDTEIKESKVMEKSEPKHEDSSDYEAPDFSDYFDEGNSEKKNVNNSEIQDIDTKRVTRSAAKGEIVIKKKVRRKKVCTKKKLAVKNENDAVKSNTITVDKSLEVQKETEDGLRYSCKLCGGSYLRITYLRNHIRSKHPNKKQYECKRCDIRFGSRALFELHIKINTECRPHQCPYCSKKFTTKNYFEEHKNTHTQVRVFKCDLCQKTFRYKQTLRRHIAWHMGLARKLMCDLCGHKFNDKTNLRKHVEVVHEKRKDFQCEFCPKKLGTKKALAAHRRLHTGETPYTCEICSCGFRTLCLLKCHKAVHGGEKVEARVRNYKCIVCSERFHDRGQFAAHVRTHAGYLPFKCPLCTKDFSCHYSLKRHIDAHSGIKRFKCNLCDTAFSQKTGIDRHMKNFHNPDVKMNKVKCELCKKLVKDIVRHKQNHVVKPYRCDLCAKAYPEKNALNRHVRLVHLGKLNQCQLCPKRYTKLRGLQAHVEKAHGTKLEVEVEFTEDTLAAHVIENKLD